MTVAATTGWMVGEGREEGCLAGDGLKGMSEDFRKSQDQHGKKFTSFATSLTAAVEKEEEELHF